MIKSDIYTVFRAALKDYLNQEGIYITDDELHNLTKTQLLTATAITGDDGCFELVSQRSLVKANINEFKEQRDIPTLLLFEAESSKTELISNQKFRLIEYCSVTQLEHNLSCRFEVGSKTSVVLVDSKVVGYTLNKHQPRFPSTTIFLSIEWEDNAYELNFYNGVNPEDETVKYIVNSRLEAKNKVISNLRLYDRLEVHSLFDNEPINFKVFNMLYDSSLSIPKGAFSIEALVFTDEDGDRVYDQLDDEIDTELPF